jgi:hypothetical protein
MVCVLAHGFGMRFASHALVRRGGTPPRRRLPPLRESGYVVLGRTPNAFARTHLQAKRMGSSRRIVWDRSRRFGDKVAITHT